MDSNRIKQMARQYGADLVGVASIDRFESLPSEQNPTEIFPECLSVIVLGRRILRGALRGVEEGTNFGSTYGGFGFRWVEDNFLSKTTYDLTCFIEANGYEAVPLFGYNKDGMPKGRPVSPGKPAPNVIVDIEYAAQAAGLGEMGLGNFFLTPEYGPRQRFACILTDLQLDPDQIWDKKICGNCEKCIEACPFGAIDIHNQSTVGVPGHTMEVADVDYAVCSRCPNGAMKLPGRGSRPDRCAAACVRACVVQLEQNKKLSYTFKNPFRKRQPWSLDVFDRPLAIRSETGKYGCDDFGGVIK